MGQPKLAAEVEEYGLFQINDINSASLTGVPILDFHHNKIFVQESEARLSKVH